VARRAVRYHRPLCPQGGAALDVGCGEGQDLAFLAECGYHATGLDFTEHGVGKALRLLDTRGLHAGVLRCDLRTHQLNHQYDLVLAVNSLQFMGEAAGACLDHVIAAVAPGGVLGLSLFAREPDEPELRNGIFFTTLPDLLARFDHQGPNRRWQSASRAVECPRREAACSRSTATRR
jgi:SAM-dependent methyltransferase